MHNAIRLRCKLFILNMQVNRSIALQSLKSTAIVHGNDSGSLITKARVQQIEIEQETELQKMLITFEQKCVPKFNTGEVLRAFKLLPCRV